MFATLTRAAGAFFFLFFDMRFWKKTCFCHFLSFLVNIWSILVNIRGYLPIYIYTFINIYIYLYIYPLGYPLAPIGAGAGAGAGRQELGPL